MCRSPSRVSVTLFRKTASNTARDFYSTTGRLSHAINKSANGFARFMGGLGGKVLFTVLATGAALLFISLLQIGINVNARTVSNVLETVGDLVATTRGPAARTSRSGEGDVTQRHFRQSLACFFSITWAWIVSRVTDFNVFLWHPDELFTFLSWLISGCTVKEFASLDSHLTHATL